MDDEGNRRGPHILWIHKGLRVLTFQKIKGFTQEKLSEDICTPENLSAIESGKRAPSIKHYDKLMEKLGMDANTSVRSRKTEVT